MEHNAQSPVIERPGAEEFRNGDAQQHQQQQQQKQQMEGVTANTDSLSLRSTKQSSSPFSRLPRNVIERYVHFFYLYFSVLQKCHSTVIMPIQFMTL